MAESKLTDLPEGWHNHEGYRAIFLAAIQGICANPHFFGAIYQGSPSAAVAFAQEVVSEAAALQLQGGSER